MKLKNYLLIDDNAVRVGLTMDRVFPKLAGKRVKWFSLAHEDKVQSSSDINKVYLTYAYYDLNGKLDTSQHNKEATQKIGEWVGALLGHGEEKDRTVLSIPHKVKIPELTDNEKKALQDKVSKDLGTPVNINLLLRTLL